MKKTLRRFYFNKFEDYYGKKCTIKKSSLTSEDCIWLRLDNTDPKILASKAKKYGLS